MLPKFELVFSYEYLMYYSEQKIYDMPQRNRNLIETLQAILQRQLPPDQTGINMKFAALDTLCGLRENHDFSS